MSIDDDEYDLDDEVLDEAFEEDLEEGLEDFDEDDDGGMSFDDDEVLFTDEELEQHEAEDEAAMAAGAQKEKFHLDIGADKLIIAGALVVGIIVLVFQVTTKTAEQRVEIFQSVLTMKGATDGEVFGGSQVESIATTAPEKQEEQKAFLYEPEALDKLPNNLKDGEHVDNVEIAPVAPEDVVQTKKSELYQVGGTAELSDEPIGEFVSVTNELIKEKPRSPQQASSKPRANPNERLRETMDQKPVDTAKGSLGINFDDVEALPTVDTSTMEQQKGAIEEAKRELNFTPIEKVMVKEEPRAPVAPPTVADKPQTAVRERTAVTMEKPDLSAEIAKQESRQELFALKMEIEKLKQEKMQLQKAAMEAKAEQQAAALEIQKEKPAEKPVAVKKEVEKPAVEEKPVVKKAAPKKKASSSRTKTLSNWKLRAAQPNKAWISMVGKQDMIAVTVGDNVRDLGEVISIDNRNGRWYVVGTNGQITQ